MKPTDILVQKSLFLSRWIITPRIKPSDVPMHPLHGNPNIAMDPNIAIKNKKIHNEKVK